MLRARARGLARQPSGGLGLDEEREAFPLALNTAGLRAAALNADGFAGLRVADQRAVHQLVSLCATTHMMVLDGVFAIVEPVAHPQVHDRERGDEQDDERQPMD